MSSDKTTTLTVIIGIIIITLVGMFVYGATGKDLTQAAIAGLLGFVSGILVNTEKSVIAQAVRVSPQQVPVIEAVPSTVEEGAGNV